MIHVLVVEDSPVVRDLLAYLLNSDPKIRVVGFAANGEEALDAVQRKKPHVVTMDIHMPTMDGFEATRRIMENHPTPIVIVSGSSTREEVAVTFRALEAGALAVVARPKGIGHPEHESSAKEFVQSVKLMSEVKVVRRWPRLKERQEIPSSAKLKMDTAPANIQVVAIGASTGGPVVLQTILSAVPRDFPIPILIVQHMAPGFIQGFAEWLGQTSGLRVQVAMHGDLLEAGRAYVAPDGFGMGVGIGGRVLLSKCEPGDGMCPSISHLLRSVADLYGKNAIGVLLSGMGKDGAEELKLLKEKGAITIVQEEETCVVPGMPGAAIQLGAETYVLPPERIGAAIARLVPKA